MAARVSRARARAVSEGTSQAMWYMPTVREPASDAFALSPMVKNAMSWWLSEAGARMKTKLPGGPSMTVSKPRTSW